MTTSSACAQSSSRPTPGKRSAAVLREALAGDHAELGGEVLDHHGRAAGEDDDPHEGVAVLGTGRDVDAEVARVDVGDRREQGRHERAGRADRPAEAPLRRAVVHARLLRHPLIHGRQHRASRRRDRQSPAPRSRPATRCRGGSRRAGAGHARAGRRGPSALRGCVGGAPQPAVRGGVRLVLPRRARARPGDPVCRSWTSSAAISMLAVAGSKTSTPKRWAPAYAAASARFLTTDRVRVGGATLNDTERRRRRATPSPATAAAAWRARSWVPAASTTLSLMPGSAPGT